MATERERQLAGELFGAGKEAQSMGAVDALKEAFQAITPGLSLDKIWSDVKTEVVQQVQHTAHELAAALFNGNAYVLYPRSSGKDDPAHEHSQQQGHGVHGAEPQKEQPQQQREGLSL